MTSEQGSVVLPVVAGGAPNRGEPATTDNSLDQMIAGGCLSITHPQTRHEDESSSLHPSPLPTLPLIQGVLNIDWWESAGCIQWGPASKDVFDEIQRCQYQAVECRQAVPCRLGDGQVLIHERGIGSGHASRLEFRLEWCGVAIGISSRSDATRLLSNFYLRIPGAACLIHGCDEVREMILTWIESWGGTLLDEWIRRLDLCLDLPALDLHQVVFPACEAGQYLSTMRKNSSYRDCDRTTGFTIGSSPGARLTIYDKLAEVKHKNDAQYGLAMIQRRWNGVWPGSAGRVEYQLHREFFQQFDGLKTATDVVARLADVVDRLIQTEQRPFFQLTDRIPDRKGRHQDRVGILPEWAAIIALIRQQVGAPRERLRKLDRGLMDAKRAVAYAVGCLTSAGAQLEMVIESKDDLIAVFAELLDRNDISDELVKLKWEDKALRCGTLVKVAEFPFGANQAI